MLPLTTDVELFENESDYFSDNGHGIQIMLHTSMEEFLLINFLLSIIVLFKAVCVS